MFKLNKQNLTAIGSTFTVLALNPLSVLAAKKDDVSISPPAGFGTLVDFGIGNVVSAALSILLGSAAIIAFFFLLWGGIQWIMAGGDKEGTEKARKRITNALIGLAIVFSSYALILILKTLFGVDVLGGVGLKSLVEY